MRTLYHFTNLPRLESIIGEGLIRPSESNIGAPWSDPRYPYGEHAAPPVVHLLDTANPFEFDHGLTGVVHDKRQVRIGVEVPGIPWRSWEWTQMMSPRWRRILADQVGVGADTHWRVFPAPIRRRRWSSIAVKEDNDTPIPEAYKSQLGPADESGYHPVSESLIEAIAGAPDSRVSPSL